MKPLSLEVRPSVSLQWLVLLLMGGSQLALLQLYGVIPVPMLVILSFAVIFYGRLALQQNRIRRLQLHQHGGWSLIDGQIITQATLMPGSLVLPGFAVLGFNKLQNGQKAGALYITLFADAVDGEAYRAFRVRLKTQLQTLLDSQP